MWPFPRQVQRWIDEEVAAIEADLGARPPGAASR